MKPRIHRFRGGWAVSNGDFATFAETREEALRQFRMHVQEDEGLPELEEEGQDQAARGLRYAYVEAPLSSPVHWDGRAADDSPAG
jgi:surface antigen